MNVVGGRTLRKVWEYHLGRQPHKTWLVFEDREGRVESYTYEGFDRMANRMAHLLRRLGVCKGDRVNLHLPNCPEFLLAWWAAFKMGAVTVPTDPRATVPEMEYLLAHSGSRVAIADPTGAETLLQAREAAPELEHVLVARAREVVEGTEALAPLLEEASEEAPEAEISPQDDVIIMYTSGTTSRPKGCVINNASIIYGCEAMARAMACTEADRHIVPLPLFHAAAMYHAVMPQLIVGGSVALMERFSASRFFDQAIRHGATLAVLFGAPLRMLLAQPERPELRDNPLRLATFAQNITPAQLEEWDRRFGVPLMQLWGMTETVGLPIINPLHYRRNNMAMGMPVLGYEVKVVDEGGREVPPGVVGELVVRAEPGVNVMKGYFKNPEATAEIFRDGWLHSGDQVWMDQEGYFYFVDRAKDIIKRAGENISAGEVEAVLREHPAVYDAAVIGVPDPVRDEAVKALVILREGAEATEEELIAWCAERLSPYKVPESVEFREEFPRTSVGKVQKHLLRRPYWEDA